MVSETIKNQIDKILEKASTFNERITSYFAEKNSSGEIIENRLKNWQSKIADGDPGAFKKKCEFDGVDYNIVCHGFSDVSINNPEIFSDWIEILEHILTLYEKKPIEDIKKTYHQLLENTHSIPFAEFFIPFVTAAQTRLKKLIPVDSSLLKDTAYRDLDINLIKRLSYVSSPTLLLEFSYFRSEENNDIYNLFNVDTGKQKKNSKSLYYGFIEKMWQKGIAFFQEYPVLARLLCTITGCWIQSNYIFIKRLKTDIIDINHLFNNKKPVGYVTSIQAGCSDYHNQGQSVYILHFSSGMKLVYKPRGMGIEQGYYKLLQWFNKNISYPPFKILKILNMRDHGWMEYVEHKPCRTHEQVKNFFRRAGMTLCLIYALRGIDFHYENVIANGEHFVLIDLEMLAIPDENENLVDNYRKVKYVVYKPFIESVLKTGILPTREFSIHKDIVMSGLGGIDSKKKKIKSNIWININTDEMDLRYDLIEQEAQKNELFLGNKRINTGDYTREIIDGFEYLYIFIMENKTGIRHEDGPLSHIKGKNARIILRTTQAYATLLEESLNSKYLRDGISRSTIIDLVYKDFIQAPIKPRSWEILMEEAITLFNLDIPIINTYTDGRDISISNKTIKNYLAQSGYELVQERIEGFNKRDMENQIRYIKASFYTSIDNRDFRNRSWDFNKHVNQRISPTEKDLLNEIHNTAEEIKNNCILYREGITWLQVSSIDGEENYGFHPLESNLYDGYPGIAFFLSAYYKLSKRSEYKELALKAVRPLLEILQIDTDQTLIKKTGIGIALGIGSLIYAFTRIAVFLDEKFLLEEARHISERITGEIINSVKNFDIVSGAAGAILAILSLYSEVGDKPILNKAAACGYHLLRNRVTSETGYRAWFNLEPGDRENKLLTGFSHGAAGIAYALLKLYEKTGVDAFKQAAVEAVEYEKSVFNPHENNWPDYRLPLSNEKNKKTYYMESWCHGAPGIGLARLGTINILNNQDIQKDIRSALYVTSRKKLTGVDHICCGNFGRIETLLFAHQVMNEKKYYDEALSKTKWCLQRKSSMNRFFLLPGLPRGLQVYGMFHGISGIGYELLRILDSQTFPSLLLFE